MTTPRRIVWLSLLPLAAAVLPAQNISRGPLAGAPLAFGVEGGLAGRPDGRVLFRRTGFANLAPVTFPTGAAAVASGTPDLESICAFHGGANLELDDHSNGRDDIMVDVAGRLAVPPNGWGILSWSYRANVVGEAGTRLRSLLQTVPMGSRGAMLFSWVLPGSLVPAGVAGVVEQSHSLPELGLAGSASPNVDALDVPLVLGVDQANRAQTEPGFAPLLRSPDILVFSVANSSLLAVPGAWWNQGGQPLPPSGAHILFTMRAPGIAGWTAPRILYNCFQLGLTVSSDVDAIAFNADEQRLIFSAVGNTAPSQLMFVDLSTDGGTGPVPVTTSGGATEVADEVGGADDDDIDAVCTLDPAIRSGVFFPDDFGNSCGTPRPPHNPAQFPVGMNASAFRRHDGGTTYYDTFLTGYPPGTQPGGGFAVCIITLGDGSVVPAFTVSFQPRPAAASLPGDPRTYSMPVPPPPVALSGLPLTFRWFAIDASLTQIAQALPVLVHL